MQFIDRHTDALAVQWRIIVRVSTSLVTYIATPAFLNSRWHKLSRLRLKCDGTRAETRFRLSAKRTSPFKSAGASVQSTSGSRVVRMSCSNAGYTMFRGCVKAIGYPLHSPVSPSLPLPCFTVYHHVSSLHDTAGHDDGCLQSNGSTRLMQFELQVGPSIIATLFFLWRLGRVIKMATPPLSPTYITQFPFIWLSNIKSVERKKIGFSLKHSLDPAACRGRTNLLTPPRQSYATGYPHKKKSPLP